MCATHGNKDDCKSVVVGVGSFSQWGRIQANLDQEDVNTPLQDKLEDMVREQCILLECADYDGGWWWWWWWCFVVMNEGPLFLALPHLVAFSSFAVLAMQGSLSVYL